MPGAEGAMPQYYGSDAGSQLSMVILAGGYSSRMGTEKSDLMYHGQTFLDIQITKGIQLGISDILVSGYRGSHCSRRVVMDRIGGRGPLGGLEASLREASHERCLVLSVDTPLVTVQELQRLIYKDRENVENSESSCRATILRHGEKQEPLIGIYPARLADEMEAALEMGRGSVFGFLKSQKYGIYLSRGGESQFRNINDKGDYWRLLRD